MKKTYTVKWGKTVVLVFRADFSQASSQIEIGSYEGDRFSGTPFQVADARHDVVAAAKLLNGWQRSEGGECWEKGTTGLTVSGRRGK